ncbi:hypothetical protein N308_10651, partial [Struthio camelus australis]
SLTLCESHLSVLLSQNRGNAGQELVPRSMNFWGELSGIAGSHRTQDTVGKQLSFLELDQIFHEKIQSQLAEFGQSASNVINVLHSFPNGVHDLGAMTTKLN